MYLNTSQTRKEDLALDLAARDSIQTGLIGVFTTMRSNAPPDC